jgi:uncharacterized membrane protein SpoIIM required for sporulation
LGAKAALTVLLHGTLEVSAIIIASAAGVVLGKSILFPGTINRWKSLQVGLKDGLKIVIGLVPVFITAAFIEGFVTRYYDMPIVFSSAILLASAAFIIWYFILYPVQVSNKQSKANSAFSS